MNKERITIPHMRTIQTLLITVEIIFIMLRLSRFLIQIIENTSSKKTEKIFTPVQMERTLPVNAILNNMGTNVAKGKMPTINVNENNYCNFFFPNTYLICFLSELGISQ